jgi:osmoprotectant transport system ATP-binding protein
MENPASDFVADFIGIERGKRALRLKKTATGTVLVDGEGRTAGVLLDDEALSSAEQQ